MGQKAVVLDILKVKVFAKRILAQFVPYFFGLDSYLSKMNGNSYAQYGKVNVGNSYITLDQN